MIAFDANAHGNSNSATSITYSHTCTGSDLMLFVNAGFNDGSTDRFSSVTYNGVAMTRLTRVSGTNGDTNLCYLAAPATGANNVVVTRSSSGNIKSCSASYTGCKQTGFPDAYGTNAVTSGTTCTKAITTVLDNCWLIVSSYNTNGGSAVTNGGTTRDNATGEIAIGDSAADQTPAGSHTSGISWTGSEHAAVIVASFAPAVAASSLLSIERTPVRGVMRGAMRP